jgi:hypothetical protein
MQPSAKFVSENNTKSVVAHDCEFADFRPSPSSNWERLGKTGFGLGEPLKLFADGRKSFYRLRSDGVPCLCPSNRPRDGERSEFLRELRPSSTVLKACSKPLNNLEVSDSTRGSAPIVTDASVEHRCKPVQGLTRLYGLILFGEKLLRNVKKIEHIPKRAKSGFKLFSRTTILRKRAYGSRVSGSNKRSGVKGDSPRKVEKVELSVNRERVHSDDNVADFKAQLTLPTSMTTRTTKLWLSTNILIVAGVAQRLVNSSLVTSIAANPADDRWREKARTKNPRIWESAATAYWL